MAGATVGFAVASRRVADLIAGGTKELPSATAHTYVLEREQLVPAPLDDVFDFFAEPANLAQLTPPQLGFRIIEVAGLPMRAGTTIEYTVRPLGFPQRWLARIEEYEPGRRFVDMQLSGPYRYWRHEHTFEPRDGGTLVRDHIEYQLPFGPLGRVANALAVARQLRAIFDYRRDVIERMYGASATV